MKKRMMALLAMAALTACGGAKVKYNITCAASCDGSPLSGVAAATASVCDVDGQDPAAIADTNVQACLNEARSGCPSATCACEAERTTTQCN